MSGIEGVDVDDLFSTAAENADYETANGGAGSYAKCLKFIGAVNQLLVVVPLRTRQSGLNRYNETEFSLEVWERRLEFARRWQDNYREQTQAQNSRVRLLGVGNWRG